MTLPDPREPPCTEAEWRAYWRIGQIRTIASPEFADRLSLAREEGLLTPLLAGDSEMVAKLASERITLLSAQINWVYPQPLSEASQPAEMTNSEQSSLPAESVHTVPEP